MIDRTHFNDYEDRPYDPELYNKDYFENKHSSGYESYASASGILKVLVDICRPVILNRVPQPYSTIDVGGAYGHVAALMNRFVPVSWNFELSEWAVAKSKELYPNVVAVQGDATNSMDWVPIPTNSFDLVTAFEFFEHVPSYSIDSILLNMARRAKWGIFLTQSRSWIGHDPDSVRGDEGHLHYHSNLWWMNKLAEFGDVDFESMTELNYNVGRIPDVLWGGRMFMVRFYES